MPGDQSEGRPRGVGVQSVPVLTLWPCLESDQYALTWWRKSPLNTALLVPLPDQEESNVAPTAALEKDNVVPAVALEKGNVAPAVALEKGKVHVLDTDYQSYVFLCLEAAAAAVPAKQSLTCQYLGACPAPGSPSQ